MKLMKSLAVAAVIVAMAACGGSSDSTTGGGGTTGTTPPATSAATMAAMTNASMWMYGTAMLIPGALPTAMVVKETYAAGNISCTGTYSGYECVIWDSLGSATSADHKCDVTGNVSSMGTTFTMAYDCVNFNPDSSVTVDGNWTVDMTTNDMGSMASASVEKGVEKEDLSGSCDVEEIADVCGMTMTVGEGSCAVECGTTGSCDAATALMAMTWTVGSRGITMTDDCGTYAIDAGTTSSIYLCSSSATGFSISFDLTGVINDGSVDEVVNIDCTGMAL